MIGNVLDNVGANTKRCCVKGLPNILRQINLMEC